jgi:hypothetical protein
VDETGEHHVKQSKPGSERQTLMSPLIWTINPKDKYIRKHKHDHIHMYRECVCNSGNVQWDSGRKERKRK